MSFTEMTCFVPECDNCGPECWHAETDGPPHFLGANVAALKVLESLCGWLVEEQADGTCLMLCPDCVRTVCDTSGHDWYTATLDLSAPAPDRPIEFCSRCSIVRRDHHPLDAPPPGHPESMTALLPDEDEWLLSEIEDIEWPSDGDTASDETVRADALARLEASKET